MRKVWVPTYVIPTKIWDVPRDDAVFFGFTKSFGVKRGSKRYVHTIVRNAGEDVSGNFSIRALILLIFLTG